MSIINFLSEHVVLPASDIATGQSVYSSLKFLAKTNKWSKMELLEFQNERLRKLINHSYNTVPYYNDLFRKHKLQPSDIKNREDLHKIPLLTKKIIREQGTERFTSSGYPKKQVISKSSSGSTGEPLHYLINKEAYSMHLAAYLRGWYTMGYRLGDKFMKISSNSRSSKIKKIQDLLSRNRYVYLSRMTSGSLEDVLHKIDSYKPKIVRCYSDPLLLLAALKKNKTNSHIPTAINTTGNILSASAREQIETAFGCKIFDSYSCEGNAVVFECPTHTCYHSTEEYSITEVLGPDSTVITEGVGKLIATDLWNFAHPFIRYDTQDLLELDNSDCMCGRQHLKVKRILGRDTEMLTTSSGNTFIVHEFTIFFSTNELLNKSVDQFQIINTKASVKMNIVVNNKFNDNIKSLLQTYWEEMLDMPVEICIVESISLGANSKRKFIINE